MPQYFVIQCMCIVQYRIIEYLICTKHINIYYSFLIVLLLPGSLTQGLETVSLSQFCI